MEKERTGNRANKNGDDLMHSLPSQKEGGKKRQSKKRERETTDANVGNFSMDYQRKGP